MKETVEIKKDIMNYIENKEYIANINVMRCFSIAMLVYFITFASNLLDFFIIDKEIMRMGFIPSVIIYFLMLIVTKVVPLSSSRLKYFILLSVICVFTLIGVTITYHVVLISLLPIVYATLYSSKKVMWYVYGLTVISTIVVVYVGYFFGVCDANMALLTATKLANYVVHGSFTLTTVNENPVVTLLVFYVIPRCLIQVAFIFACNSIFRIIKESTEKAAYLVHLENLEVQKAEMEKEKAYAANKAKSMFLSSMSHEIRTPMNAIIGMTEMLLRGNHSPETIEYLNNIKVSGDALLTIINDILDLSKIESGKMDIIMIEYEPMSAFHDLSMIFLNRIGDKPVELIYDIDADLPCKLYGDIQRIRQIIINLMNNAIKFTEEGFVKLTVKAKMVSEDMVELSYFVEDSGTGIKPEDIGKLFSSYEQVDQEKNYYKEGTGLGLSISQNLVEMMGGTIGVESEYGKGSTFYFTILQEVRCADKACDVKPDKKEVVVVCEKIVTPLIKKQFEYLVDAFGLRKVSFAEVYEGKQKADLVFTDDIEMLTEELCNRMESYHTKLCVVRNPMYHDLSEKKVTLVNKPLYSLNFCQVVNGDIITVESENDLLNFTAPKAQILIVDDNEMNIKVAKGLLEPLCMQIDIAENGKQAVEKIKTKKYDMVFMDHMMPIMDGVEATKVIRQMEEPYYKELPIVALSANATQEARELFQKNGFVDFVAKPIKLKTLCECICTWLPKEYIVLGTAKEAVDIEITQIEIPRIPGISIQEGIKNSGSKELYLNLLADFYKLVDQKSVKLEKCLADGMLRDYTIEVHALKTTARMIGAMELSEKFYELEKLGDAKDQITLEKLTPDVIALYRNFKVLLEPFAKSMEQKKEQVSTEEMIETLEQLSVAIDNFDLDGADNAMHKLEGYVFPEECRSMVECLSAYVADVAMEEVMELTESLIHKLQQES